VHDLPAAIPKANLKTAARGWGVVVEEMHNAMSDVVKNLLLVQNGFWTE